MIKNADFIVYRPGQYPVILKQNKRLTFTVHYGANRYKNLSYAEAAHRFGECVFHALSCEGKINNEEP